MKIHLIGEAASHRHVLEAHLPNGLEMVALPQEAAGRPDFDDGIGASDAVVSLRFSRKGVQAPRFSLLHVPGAGFDGIDFGSLHEDVSVCNVFEHEIPIAEFVMAGMLQNEQRAIPRNFSPKDWPELYRDRVAHGELRGKVLGLVGFGHIGQTIAVRAKAFGMRIVAVTRNGGDGGGLADQLLSQAEIGQMLGQADYIVVACALTDETRGLIGRRALATMKKTAIVINVARAEIIEEEALFETLQDRKIGGAILDVWYRYPLTSGDLTEPSRFPFHVLDNVVRTPHSSAWTKELVERRYAFIAGNIRRLLAGEPLHNVVWPPQAAELRAST